MKKRMLLIMSLVTAAALIAAACGGGEPAPTATRAPTPTPTPISGGETTPPDQEATQPPSGPVSLSISVVGDELKFTESSFTVGTGAQVTLTLDNVSNTQQHNWVLVEAGSKDDISNLGAAVGDPWIPVDDPRVLANTDLLDPGVSGSITFQAPASGAYEFVCTFPGHNPTMFGDFIVQ